MNTVVYVGWAGEAHVIAIDFTSKVLIRVSFAFLEYADIKDQKDMLVGSCMSEM
jgi:hypothetical protein